MPTTAAAESPHPRAAGGTTPVRRLLAAAAVPIVGVALALGAPASAHPLYNTNRVLEHTDNECLNLRHNKCRTIWSPRVSVKVGDAKRIELACVPGRPFLLGWDARHHEHIGLTLVSPPPADLRAAAAASAATTTAEPESITVLATNQADARGFVRLFIGCTAEPVVGAPFARSRQGLPSKALRRVGN